MNKITYSLLLCAVALVLNACVPVAPVPTSTSKPSYPPSNGPGAPVSRDSGGSGENADAGGQGASAGGDPIKPVDERQVRGGDAVAALLEQSWSYYRSGQYDAAIAVAERAQRLDSGDPEIYLVLGSAHFAQYRVSLAEQLVRKGLAFSRAGTSVQRRLQGLLAEISAAP